MSQAQDLVRPAPEGYSPLRDLPPKFAGKLRMLSDELVYFLDSCSKHNKRVGMKEGIFIVTTHFVFVTDTAVERVKKVLMHADLEKLLLASDTEGLHAAFIPTKQSNDPAFMLLLKRRQGRDPFLPFKIVSWLRQSQVPTPLESKQVTAEEIKGLHGTTAVHKPQGYLKSQSAWMKSKVQALKKQQAASFKQQQQQSLQLAPRGDVTQGRRFMVKLPPRPATLGMQFSEYPGGVVSIDKVDPGLAAEEAGLYPGLLLHTVGDHPIATVQDVVDAVNKQRDALPGMSVSFEVFAYPSENVQQEQQQLTVQNQSFGQPAVSTGSSDESDPFSERRHSLLLREKELTDREARLAEQQEMEVEKLKRAEERIAALERSQVQMSAEVADDALRQQQQHQQLHPQAHENILTMEDMIERHLSVRPAPTITPLPNSISFESDGDIVSFAPEEGGLGEYLNGVKVSKATILFWNPQTRLLKDQNGAGGPLPTGDPTLLTRISHFLEHNAVPVKIENGSNVEYSTTDGDVIRYTTGMGRLYVSFNGTDVGFATKISFNPMNGMVRDQTGAGWMPPEEKRDEVVNAIAELAELCDVEHNIPIEGKEGVIIDDELPPFPNGVDPLGVTTATEDQAFRSIADLKLGHLNLLQLKEEREKELKERQEEEEKRAELLKKKEEELEQLERELNEREKAADEKSGSPLGVYHLLRTELEHPSIDERKIIEVVSGFPNSFFWYDVCGFFRDDGDDLPAQLHRLSPPTVKAIEAALIGKGIRLPDRTAELAKQQEAQERRRKEREAKSKEKEERRKQKQQAKRERERQRRQREREKRERQQQQQQRQQLAKRKVERQPPNFKDLRPSTLGGTTVHGRNPAPSLANDYLTTVSPPPPSFRRYLTTPAAPQQAQDSSTAPEAVLHQPHPLARGTAASRQLMPRPQPASAPLRPPLHISEGGPVFNSPSFTNPLPTALSPQWAQVTIKQLEEAHDLLSSVTPPRRYHESTTMAPRDMPVPPEPTNASSGAAWALL